MSVSLDRDIGQASLLPTRNLRLFVLGGAGAALDSLTCSYLRGATPNSGLVP
jgi:hypothetical protein